MPYDNPEPDDPMQLTGVSFRATVEGAINAACAFTEELARTGMSEDAILRVFRTPHYRGPFGVYLTLGPFCINKIVHETAAAFQACRDTARERAAS
ncbi:MAG: hypothetical protein AMXMBFR4_16670 [Candidatus Hydrogenedentota bacterium]